MIMITIATLVIIKDQYNSKRINFEQINTF